MAFSGPKYCSVLASFIFSNVYEQYWEYFNASIVKETK